MDTLPLAEYILRAITTTRVNRTKVTEKGGTREVALDGINTLIGGWEITYKPLSITDRNTLISFLDTKRASKRFLYTPCNINDRLPSGDGYKVRRAIDTLQEVRYNDKYVISFTLQFVA